MNSSSRPQYLILTGILYEDNRLVLQPSFITDDPKYSTEDINSPLIVEMSNDKGQVTSRYRVPTGPLKTQQKNELGVIGKVPFPPETRLIRFYREKVLIHKLDVPKNKPTVRINWQPPAKAEGTFDIEWVAEHRDNKEMHFLVLYSNSNGKSWRPLSLPSANHQFRINFDDLAGGLCRIGIVATDGVNTVWTTSPNFRVPTKPCLAMILSPLNGARVQADNGVNLWGQGYYLEENKPEYQNLYWISDKDGILGRGANVALANVSPGKHRITLVAGTKKRTGKASILINIIKNRPKYRKTSAT